MLQTWAPGRANLLSPVYKRIHDSGTEMGTGFSPDNEAEDPHMPISMIMCDGMAFCEAGEDIKPVAKITVTKM